FLHLGLPSSDVLDAGSALQLRAAAELLLVGQDRLIAALRTLGLAHKKTLMIGRTHGMHAEPITFGIKVASWHAEAVRNRARLVAATDEIAVGTISGAVGVFGNVAPEVEAYVLERLPLRPEPVPTQIVPRRRGWSRAPAMPRSSPRSRSWAARSSGSRSRSGTCNAPRSARRRSRSPRDRRARPRCRTSATPSCRRT